jgi:UDP-N-acetylmuramate: L-alanyl-gamma-D-glutamyl-meso-diaminopimelate ligase
VKSAFLHLMRIIPGDGALVVCSDYPAAMEIAAAAPCQRVTYGAGDNVDWNANDLHFHEGRSFFEPSYRGKTEGRIEAAVIGRHNVMNALAVYAMGRVMGIGHEQLADAFRTFSGVKRRQEIRGEQRGILLIDDFAHHPTAVRETIEAIKAAYRGRRLWAVFEPRSNTSKRNIFAKEFADALSLADRVILASVYQPEKVPEGELLSVQNLAREINCLTSDDRARTIENTQDIACCLAKDARSGDVVLVMSNGGFDAIQEKILQALAG